MTEITEISLCKTVASPEDCRQIENCISSIKALKMPGPKQTSKPNPTQLNHACLLLDSAHGLAKAKKDRKKNTKLLLVFLSQTSYSRLEDTQE